MKTIAAMSVLAAAGSAAILGHADEAAAQPRPISEIIVFGEDPCPRSTEDNVVVCARKPESERYRIPEEFRNNGSRQESQSWSVNARYLETVNDNGIRRCSPVGPQGFTGCLQELIDTNMAEREEFDEEEVFVPQ